MTNLFSAVPRRLRWASVRLADVIGGFLGKVEIVLAGADEDLRDGQEALAAGDAMAARAAAHRVLDAGAGFAARARAARRRVRDGATSTPSSR